MVAMLKYEVEVDDRSMICQIRKAVRKTVTILSKQFPLMHDEIQKIIEKELPACKDVMLDVFEGQLVIQGWIPRPQLQAQPQVA